jgi:hypothetical protein
VAKKIYLCNKKLKQKQHKNMEKHFEKFDWDAFWCEDGYSLQTYTGKPLAEDAVMLAENELGYKLPSAYIELLENKNGGTPANTCFPTDVATSWAENHIEICGILGINNHDNSLLQECGTKFMIEEWGYPEIGIIVCDCPSAGHDSVMLDYRNCGNYGEPQVVHVDVEIEDKPVITFLAKDFETFIRGLVNEDVFFEKEVES